MRTGNLECARNSYEEALTIALTFGSVADQVTAQTNLAGLLLMSDDAHDLTSGLDMYQECLFTFRRLGDRRNEANALIGIGIGHHRLGRYPEAAGHHTRALELARDIGAAHEEAHALHRLGVAEAALGNLGEAAGHLEMSLALADRTQEREQQARSLDALAGVRLQEGRRETAQELWQYAFGIFQELDTSEAARIGRKLASLTETEPHSKRRHRST